METSPVAGIADRIVLFTTLYDLAVEQVPPYLLRRAPVLFEHDPSYAADLYRDS